MNDQVWCSTVRDGKADTAPISLRWNITRRGGIGLAPYFDIVEKHGIECLRRRRFVPVYKKPGDGNRSATVIRDRGSDLVILDLQSTE